MNKKRSKAIKLTLPIDLLNALNKVAKRKGHTRSELALEGMQKYMAEIQPKAK